MKQKIMFLFICLLTIWQIKAQTGTTFSTAITLTATPGYSTGWQTTTFDTIWYKYQAESEQATYNLIYKTGFTRILDRIICYKDTNYLMDYQDVMPSSDSSIKANIANLNIGETHYLAIVFKTISCDGCTVTPTAQYKINSVTAPLTIACSNPTVCAASPICELVCNGSFEIIGGQSDNGGGSVPALHSQIAMACGWNNANIGNATVDLFNVSGAPMVDIPCNMYGDESERTGKNNYAGFYAYSTSATDYKESLFSQLKAPLLMGHTYQVSFYLSLADQSVYNATGSNVGVAFSNNYTPGGTNYNINTVSGGTQYFNTSSLSKTGWQQYSFSYSPVSANEEFIVIGALKTSGTIAAVTPSLPCGGSQLSNPYASAYYYLDDVSVTEITDYAIIPHFGAGCPPPIDGLSVNPPNAASSYTWTSSPVTPTLSTQHGYSIAISPSATTIYTVDALGCGTETYTVNPSIITPTFAVTSSTNNICAGTPVILSAASSGLNTFTWTSSPTTATLSSQHGTSVTVTPSVTTTYTVIGAMSGCPNTYSATISITVVTGPSFSLSSTTVCAGTSLTVTANQSTADFFDFGDGNPNYASGDFPNPYTYTTPGTYTVIVGGYDNICNIYDYLIVPVTVLPAGTNPTLTITPSQTAICIGQSVTLTAGGATSYTWNPTAITGSSIVVSPTTTTVYTLTGATSCGQSTKTISITVNPVPTLTVTATPTAICSGQSTTLTAIGAITYIWNPGGSTSHSITVSPTVTTIYTVTGSNSNCLDTKTVTVNVTTTPTVSIVGTPTNVCAGSSATLTALGASTFSWNTGATTASIVVTPTTISTTYTVTGRNGTCSNVKTISIIRTLPLVPTATASPTTICAGNATTLTASSATTYTWLPGGANTRTVVVNPTSTTVYTLAVANAACISTTTVLVNVNTLPTITTTSAGTICSGSGSTATLTALGGTTTYTWSTGSTSNPTTVSPSVTTTYTVTGSNGTCSNTRTVTVNVTTTPTVSITGTPTLVCAGSSSTLTALGASTFSWSTGATTASIVVTPTTTSTTYTVTGRNGTCSNVKTIVITRTTTPTVNASASPTIICAGLSTTLTATGASTYTWNPGALTGSSVSVSPSVTTTYTVTGRNSTCSNTTTVLVNVNPVPTISLSPLSSGICTGQSLTVTASGTSSTYSWSTGATTATLAMTPTTTTIYTVTGTGSSGCKSSRTYTLIVNALPAITATASPSVICAGSSSTLSMTAGGTLNSWSNGIFGNTTTVTPSVTTTYTAYTTNLSTTCSNSTVITVTVNPFTSLTVNPSTICVGQTATLTAAGATSYTWSTGASTPSITVSPTVTTNYTVSGVGSSCNSSLVLTVVVNNNPTITATASPTNVCVGNTSTLTASGATSYSWSSGATTAVTTVTPGAVSIYTVTGTTNGCSATKTVQIALTPQYCCQSASFTIGTSTTSATNYSNTSNGNGAVIDMQGTITFSANSTMSNYIIRMAPSSKIVIYAGVTLTFSNCTIYSCTELWQGIVIQENAGDAGNLNVINSSIEDMYVGISMVGPYYTYPSSSTNGNVTITNSKLNKNYASIYMNTFPKYDDNGLFQYGLSVTGSTISSVYSPTSPQSTLKTSSTYTYAYNTIDNVTVPYTYFPRSHAGIVLNNLSDSPVIVGDKTGTNGSNRFENLDFGIVVIDAHLKAYNNHFINIKGSAKYITTSAGPDEIGIGIYAMKTNTANRQYPITIGEGTTTPNGSNALPAGNRFEDCGKGIRVDDYDGEVALKGNEFISNANTVVNPLALPPNYLYFYNTAQNGIWIKNVQIKATVTNNYIKNHTFGIYSSHNILSSFISTAFVKIDDNLIEAPSTTGFCTQAIEVSQPASTNNLLAGKLTVKNNTIQNVYRGIKGSNVKGGLQINSNPVINLSAAKVYGITGTTSQINNFERAGIRLDNCVDAVVANNPNITSNGTINSAFYTAVKGIMMFSSGGTNAQVNCNVISNMGRSMQFNGSSINKVAKNVMNGTYQGLVLSNSGIIGPQGVSGTMTNDNEWYGFTGGAAQYAETYTQLTSNANVFPSGSVLFVKPGSPYQPTQNYSSNGNPYVTGSGDGIRSQSLSTPGESCLSLRLMGENNNAGMAMRTATDEDSTATRLYEVLASDTTYYEVYQDETQYLNKQLVYELLNTQSIEATQNLQDFYTANQSGTYHDFVNINASIGTENYTTAQSINDGITATNVIESYQKRVNELLLKYLSYQSQSVLTNSLSVPLFNTIAVYDDTELNDLTAIANSCLDKYGNVVTQARVLLNNVSNTQKEYENNCNPEYSQRKGKTNKATVISNGITANVLPNPNNGNFILQYDLAKYPSADLVIYDVTGKLMLKESLTNTEKQIHMNVDKFENGIYYYTITTNKEILVANKFVIIK